MQGQDAKIVSKDMSDLNFMSNVPNLRESFNSCWHNYSERQVGISKGTISN